jgi:hypothetical protein
LQDPRLHPAVIDKTYTLKNTLFFGLQAAGTIFQLRPLKDDDLQPTSLTHKNGSFVKTTPIMAALK